MALVSPVPPVIAGNAVSGIKIVRMRESLIVGAGAVLGAFARWGLSLAAGSLAMMAAVPHAGIWSLLLINILGAGLMGYFQPGPFWGKGVLGGFTSFSTFATATVALTALGALGHVVVTVAGCVLSYLLGDALRSPRSRVNHG